MGWIRANPKLSGDERRWVVVETARRLVIPGVDALKAEFPLDFKANPDETVWAEACAELSAASAAPWVLLSASVDYDTYLRQVTIACNAGASGVAVRPRGVERGGRGAGPWTGSVSPDHGARTHGARHCAVRSVGQALD